MQFCSHSSLFKIVTLSFLTFPAYSLSDIHLVTSRPQIIEEFSFYYPGKPASISVEKEVVMPNMRSIAGFGGLTQEVKSNKTRAWCGPSPRTNTLNCFDFNHSGNYIASYPVPGKISSTPLFYDNSWLFGTAKGYLVRVEADVANRNLPKLSHDNINLWGTRSRHVMFDFKQKPIYAENSSSLDDPTLQYENPKIPFGVKWIFPASSSFIGTPVIKNGLVYIFAASQYFQAFNWNTGKLEWAIRLAPSASIRMNSNAFVVTDNEILVGNSLGTLMSLNPNNGSVLWTWEVPQATQTQRIQAQLPAGPDKFYGIVSTPFVTSKNIVVSNAESMTQSISVEKHELIWSYPEGSVAQPKIYKNNLLIGTSSGKILSLNNETGSLNWSVKITQSSPIMSLFLTKNNILLATTRLGKIFMVQPETGEILGNNKVIGEVNGEFFAGFSKADACLNFAANGVRCFRVKL